MRRTKRLLDEVRSRTGHDIKRKVRIVICEDEQRFLSIQSKMRGENYSFPRDTNDIDALYFSNDRYIVISPNVRPGTISFDRVFLHECGHDLISHEIPKDIVRRLRRTVSKRRNEIDEAYTSVGRNMPWGIEERLADMLSAALIPHTQRGWSKMKKIAIEIMEPILK